MAGLGYSDKILYGDINADLLQLNSNRNISNLYEGFVACGLLPCVSYLTHLFTRRATGEIAGTLIDNIFCTNNSYLKSGVLNFSVSDHLPIFILFGENF